MRQATERSEVACPIGANRLLVESQTKYLSEAKLLVRATSSSLALVTERSKIACGWQITDYMSLTRSNSNK